MAGFPGFGGMPIPSPLTDFMAWVATKTAAGAIAVQKTIAFVKDPIGFITTEFQRSVEAVSGVLIPFLMSALEPDYSAKWWVGSYTASFSMAMLIMAVLLIAVTMRRRRGIMGAKEMLSTFFVAGPLFLGGASLGPLIGAGIGRVFAELTSAVAQWGLNTNTQEYWSWIGERAKAADAKALLGSVFITWIVLLVLLLALIGVSFILLIQLATIYLVGALVPLGLVWIMHPRTRKLGLMLPTVWLAINFSHVLLIFLLGIAFRMINGMTLDAATGMLPGMGDMVTPDGLTKQLKTFVNLAVPAVVSFLVVFAPMRLLKLIPHPFGGGGQSGSMAPPPIAPQVPQPATPHQQAGKGGNTPQQPKSTSATAPVQPTGQAGTGGQGQPKSTLPSSSPQASTAGKAAAAGSAPTGHAAGQAAGQAGQAAAGTAARGAAATAGSQAARTVGTQVAGKAAVGGLAATGVGAPIAVAALVANQALRIAHTAAQHGNQVAEQVTDAADHQQGRFHH